MKKQLLYLILFLFLNTYTFANTHKTYHVIINSTATPQPDHNQNLATLMQQTTQHMLSHMQAATLAYLDSHKAQPTISQAEQQKLHNRQVKTQHHKHEFGVDETKLKQLYSMSYEQLESWILQSINLKRHQAINIWNGYCLKRIIGSDKKDTGRQHIHEKFDKQDQVQQEQRAAERTHQQKLQKLYQLEAPDLHELDSDTQQRWTLRQQALQQTKQESFKEHHKTYVLDPLASGYLMALNINHLEYEHLTGTVLQHHLHRETLSIIEQTAQIQQSLSYQSSTLKQVVLLNDISIIANQSSLFDWTTHLNDINYGMLGFICNMSKSGLRSLSVAAEQFSSSALNAPALFAQGIADIANLLTTIIYHQQEPTPEIILDQEHLHEQINQQHLLYSHILDSISQATQYWYQTKTAQEKADDIIKATVDMGANIIIPDLILQKCALALGYMAGNLKNLRSLECVANLLEEKLSFQTALESETYIEHKVAQETMHFMETEAKFFNRTKTITKVNKETCLHHLNEFSENKNNIIHMFRNKPGKLKDTPENRNKILKMVKDKNNFLGQDERGNVWYATVEKDGTQLYAEVFNYKIRNCGFNKANDHRSWNKKTGLKRLYKRNNNDK